MYPKVLSVKSLLYKTTLNIGVYYDFIQNFYPEKVEGVTDQLIIRLKW